MFYLDVHIESDELIEVTLVATEAPFRAMVAMDNPMHMAPDLHPFWRLWDKAMVEYGDNRELALSDFWFRNDGTVRTHVYVANNYVTRALIWAIASRGQGVDPGSSSRDDYEAQLIYALFSLWD